MAGSKILAFFIAFAMFVNLCDAVPALFDFQHDSNNECRDEHPNCVDIVQHFEGDQQAVEQYCRRWQDNAAVRMCRKTCNLCSKAPSPPKATKGTGEEPTECRDEHPNCVDIVQHFEGDQQAVEQYCRRWQDNAAVRKCRKTCNLCSKAPSPTGEPQTEELSTKPVTEKTTAAPKPTMETGEPTGFQKVCLEAHNYYRFLHGVPPLKWSGKLSRDAQSWANHLAITNKFDHDPTARGKDQGENLYYTIPSKRLCEHNEHDEDCIDCWDIVKLWYDEESDYDYVTGKAKNGNAVVLHFTQLVWKASKELGMATAVAHDRLVAVARYSPVGNYIGEFKENVSPPNL